MRLPLVLPVGPLALQAHLVLEALAWAVGFALLARGRRRDPLGRGRRWTLTAAALVGAVVGAKLAHWSTEWPRLVAQGTPLAWLGGKSVVGALVGGTLAVELAKARAGVRGRTGDLWVPALVASLAVGRVGCFLSGLADHTHGVATALPWGVDLGDGVRRHPVQLYEVGWLALFALLALPPRARLARPLRATPGRTFDAFLLGYLGLRLVLDAWKPYPRLGGLAGTQVWALAGIVLWSARLLWLARRERSGARPAAAGGGSPA